MYLCSIVICFCVFFFVKQKTAYEMRISDWSSDVCSSDLVVNDERIIKANHGSLLPASWRTLYELTKIKDDATFERAIESGAGATKAAVERAGKIGRASCRERVCQYV